MSVASTIRRMGLSSATQRALTGSHLEPSSLVTVEITGLKELEAALLALPEKVARKTLTAAMRDASEALRSKAAQLAPYKPEAVKLGHPAWRTMYLRDGIKKSVSVKWRGVLGADVKAIIGLDKKHAWFGRIVERGYGRQQPQPFMRPAWESMKETLVQMFRTRLADGIAKAARELYRRAA